MKILVNYMLEEEKYLSPLASILSRRGLEAFSTKKTYDMEELLLLAHKVGVSAIVLVNESTLQNIIPPSVDKKSTLDNWRGSRLNFTIPIIVINKLAHLYTVAHGPWLLEKDLDKLKYLGRKPREFSYTKLLDPKEFNDAFDDLSKSFCIYYDIETKTFPNKKMLLADGTEIPGAEEVGETIITCLSWTGMYLDGSLRTYMLPFVDFHGPHWEHDKDWAKALRLAKKVNALKIPKAMHNGMYDATHSIIYNIEPVNWTLDTMALAHAEFAELPKSLDFVTSYQAEECYDYINWKGDAASASFGKDQEKYWRYNARDTWWGARVLVSQLRNLPAYGFTNYKQKFQLVYPSLYCNFEGFLIDQNARMVSRANGTAEINRSKASLRVKFADPEFNPGSWQQVQHYIYKIFGAQKPGIGKSKSATDEKNLIAVGEQHPLLGLVTSDILTFREHAKAVSTYHDFVQCKGRLLWALNPFGAETERMACNASSLWCGTQVQNIPGYAKGMLIADPGYVLFEADNKQSEGRTTAYLSQEENLIAALEDPLRDFYLTLGTLFFNIPYEEVTEFFRNKVIKRVVHGTNYMMGAWTFIENVGIRILLETAPKLGISIVEIPAKGAEDQMTLRQFSQFLLDSYHKPFPRVREFYKEIKNEIATTGYLVSPLGHTRKFFGDINKDHTMLRSAVAHKPQNLSGAVLNKGYLRFYKQLVIPGNGDVRLKAQIHDSLLGQIREDMVDYYAPRILECMDNPIVVHGRTMRIPVDIGFGKNWAKSSSKNEKGMKGWKPPVTIDVVAREVIDIAIGR